MDFGDGGNELRNYAGQVKFWRRRVRYLDIGMFILWDLIATSSATRWGKTQIPSR